MGGVLSSFLFLNVQAISEWHMQSFSALRDLVSSTKRFAVLREKMRNITPPCIPYLGSFLLTLANLTLKRDVSNGSSFCRRRKYFFY